MEYNKIIVEKINHNVCYVIKNELRRYCYSRNLWVSASISLTEYINNRILCNMEPGDTKSLILGLYHNTNKLGNKIDILLFNASLYGAGPGKLEKLYDLTGKYLEALQMLYITIGRDEYIQQMTYLVECVNSPDYRETAEDLLEPFYTGN